MLAVLAIVLVFPLFVVVLLLLIIMVAAAIAARLLLVIVAIVVFIILVVIMVLFARLIGWLLLLPACVCLFGLSVGLLGLVWYRARVLLRVWLEG
jgi:hypothetical protein